MDRNTVRRRMPWTRREQRPGNYALCDELISSRRRAGCAKNPKAASGTAAQDAPLSATVLRPGSVQRVNAVDEEMDEEAGALSTW